MIDDLHSVSSAANCAAKDSVIDKLLVSSFCSIPKTSRRLAIKLGLPQTFGEITPKNFPVRVTRLGFIPGNVTTKLSRKICCQRSFACPGASRYERCRKLLQRFFQMHVESLALDFSWILRYAHFISKQFYRIVWGFDCGCWVNVFKATTRFTPFA